MVCRAGRYCARVFMRRRAAKRCSLRWMRSLPRSRRSWSLPRLNAREKKPQISPFATFCRKHIQEESAETADPSASLGMTKERAAFVWRVVTKPKTLLNTLALATTFHRTTTLSFVIPSEAEGSAVSADPSWICFRQNVVGRWLGGAAALAKDYFRFGAPRLIQSDQGPGNRW